MQGTFGNHTHLEDPDEDDECGPTLEERRSNAKELISLLSKFDVLGKISNNMKWYLAYLADANEEELGLLLASGMDINEKDEDGCTPLMHAFVWKDITLPKVLIDLGADINTKDVNRVTPLMYALKYGNAECAKRLVDMGADLFTGDDILCFTPLHYAAFSDNVEIAKTIIERGNIDVSSRYYETVNPLHVAAEYGSQKMINLFLELGADVTERSEISGLEPCLVAAKNGHEKLARQLYDIESKKREEKKGAENSIFFQRMVNDFVSRFSKHSDIYTPINMSRQTFSNILCIGCE